MIIKRPGSEGLAEEKARESALLNYGIAKTRQLAGQKSEVTSVTNLLNKFRANAPDNQSTLIQRERAKSAQLQRVNQDGQLENERLAELFKLQGKLKERQEVNDQDRINSANNKAAIASWVSGEGLYAAAGAVMIESEYLDDEERSHARKMHPNFIREAEAEFDPARVGNPFYERDAEQKIARMSVDMETGNVKVSAYEASVPESWNSNHAVIMGNLEGMIRFSEVNQRMAELGYSEEKRLGLIGTMTDMGDEITPKQQLIQLQEATQKLEHELNFAVENLTKQRQEITNAMSSGDIKTELDAKLAGEQKLTLDLQLHKDSVIANNYELERITMQVNKPELSLYNSDDLENPQGINYDTAAGLADDLKHRLSLINEKAEFEYGIDQNYWNSIKTFGDNDINSAEREAFSDLAWKGESDSYERKTKAAQITMGQVYDLSKELAAKEVLIQTLGQIKEPEKGVVPGRGINTMTKLGHKAGMELQAFYPSSQDIAMMAGTVDNSIDTSHSQNPEFREKLNNKVGELQSDRHIIEYQKDLKNQLSDFMERDKTANPETQKHLMNLDYYNKDLRKAADYVLGGNRDEGTEHMERERARLTLIESVGSEKTDIIMKDLDRARKEFKSELSKGVDNDKVMGKDIKKSPEQEKESDQSSSMSM